MMQACHQGGQVLGSTAGRGQDGSARKAQPTSLPFTGPTGTDVETERSRKTPSKVNALV